jgi:hypothetical protein
MVGTAELTVPVAETGCELEPGDEATEEATAEIVELTFAVLEAAGTDVKAAALVGLAPPEPAALKVDDTAPALVAVAEWTTLETTESALDALDAVDAVDLGVEVTDCAAEVVVSLRVKERNTDVAEDAPAVRAVAVAAEKGSDDFDMVFVSVDDDGVDNEVVVVAIGRDDVANRDDVVTGMASEKMDETTDVRCADVVDSVDDIVETFLKTKPSRRSLGRVSRARGMGRIVVAYLCSRVNGPAVEASTSNRALMSRADISILKILSKLRRNGK